MATDNHRVAQLLYELGALSERHGDRSRRFRADAYRRAADTVATVDDDVLTLSLEQLTALPHIGPGTAARIDELRRTGSIARLDELRAIDPLGAEELLRVPGLGPRSVARLRDALGVHDVAGLRVALDDGRVRTVRGMGSATEQRLRAALHGLDLDQAGGPAPLPIADAVRHAARLSHMVGRLDAVAAVSWAGAVGRLCDTATTIDLVVATATPAAALRAATALPAVREPVDGGDDEVTVATFDGPDLRLAAAPPDRVGVTMVRATATPAHWRQLAAIAAERGARLTPRHLTGADGTPLDTPDAESVYRALDLQPVPAEQRDGTDELTLARHGGLPPCAGVDELRGDLHDHTDWSGDGRMTLRELFDAAAARGWEYVAVTDHAEDLRINGLDRAAMHRQRAAIRRLHGGDRTPMLLHGAELNIGADGSVDYDPAFVAGFDFTVASVHSAFDLDVAAQTARVITAVRNPAVHAIGHLTGRRIGRRPGIRLDADAVLDACAETGTALEANCHLDRLDAPADVLREAATRGVLVTIATDAHRRGDLDHHVWGVRLARRGRVPRDLVVNTWPVDRVLRWLRST